MNRPLARIERLEQLHELLVAQIEKMEAKLKAMEMRMDLQSVTPVDQTTL